MRTLKWDPWFEPDVETSIGVGWISFPDLPLNFFAKEAIFSIATAVGTPLTVDMATKNQTRPSCARIKVEVDLTAKLPQRVRITEEDDHTGAIKYKWIKKEEEGYRTITKTGTDGEPYRVLTSGKVMGQRQHKQEWMEKYMSRREKRKKPKIRKKVLKNGWRKTSLRQAQCKKKMMEIKKDQKKNIQQASQEEHSMQEEEGKTEMDTEGTLVIYEANNDKVLPLAMVKDSREEAYDTTEIIRNKDALSHIIAKVTIEGDLSPQQAGKLRESHTKPKKKGRELNADKASSRSKRMIIKNSKYL
ncbi:hypothetical protein KY285_026822 [Solanum tuberosum]|nr:hypothetical protein KY285_026822 [Solanum tuberosum]